MQRSDRAAVAARGEHGRQSVLYMCYDGVLEPLGESQVVAYLEHLARDYAVHLISFEKPADLNHTDGVDRMTRRLQGAGIVWHPMRYHKHPKLLSTMWDMAVATIVAAWLALRHDVGVLHARSVLCAAMLYPAKMLGRGRFLIDIRGFWVDERVDGGMIRRGGFVFRTLKRLERAMLRRADHIVTLTDASIPVLRDDRRMGPVSAPITVIPTCADLKLFTPERGGDGEDRSAPLTIGYAGQVGTWYMLDEMLAFFAAVRRHRPDARLLIVNTHQQATVRAAVARSGIDPEIVEIVASDRSGMPRQMRRMDAGLALIHPFFSKLASAPTKLAEYLGCGVPVVGNVGCGDMARIIADERIGVALVDTRPATIEAAALELLEGLGDPTLSPRCVSAAHARFSLEEGVRRYRLVYRELLGAA